METWNIFIFLLITRLPFCPRAHAEASSSRPSGRLSVAVSEPVVCSLEVLLVGGVLRPEVVEGEGLLQYGLERDDSVLAPPTLEQSRSDIGPRLRARSMTSRSSGDHSTITIFEVSTIFP
jgi:hypothetical protein